MASKKNADPQGYEAAPQERKPDWNVATQGAPPEGTEEIYNVVPIAYAGDQLYGPGGQALGQEEASSDDSAADSSDGSDAGGSDSGQAAAGASSGGKTSGGKADGSK